MQLKEDQGLAPEARAAALAGIRQETEQVFQTAMGAKGWEQFSRLNYKWWLDAIYKRSTEQSNAAAPKRSGELVGAVEAV